MITRDSFNEILDIGDIEITYATYHFFFIKKFGDYSVQDHLLPINADFPNPGIAREKAYVRKMREIFLAEPNGVDMVTAIDNAVDKAQMLQEKMREIQKKHLDVQEDLKNQWNKSIAVISGKT